MVWPSAAAHTTPSVTPSFQKTSNRNHFPTGTGAVEITFQAIGDVNLSPNCAFVYQYNSEPGPDLRAVWMLKRKTGIQSGPLSFHSMTIRSLASPGGRISVSRFGWNFIQK